MTGWAVLATVAYVLGLAAYLVLGPVVEFIRFLFTFDPDNDRP